MNTTSDKLNYLAETKTAIKDAIVAKGVAVAESDTFRSYAGKIGEIQSGGGADFSEIGYESTPQYILDGIEYAKKIQQEWNNQQSGRNLFQFDKNILFFPNVDTSLMQLSIGMFKDSTLQYVDILDFSSMEDMSHSFRESSVIAIRTIVTSDALTNMYWAFIDCTKLKKIGEITNTSKVTNFRQCFQTCRLLNCIEKLDFSSVTDMVGCFQTPELSFLRIDNLGKSTLSSYNFSTAPKWGKDTTVVGSRQSLIDSLITYSFDRASAGMPTATITLHQDVQARLTEEEIAIINSKGFTLA